MLNRHIFNVADCVMALLDSRKANAFTACMKPREIFLYENQASSGMSTGCEAEPGKFCDIHAPTLLAYLPDKLNGASVVICPGGGYGMVSCINEGYPVAEWLAGLGFCAYVLKYRLPSTCPEYRHPVPLDDLQRALRMVRGFAARDGMSVDRVGLLGFSAGAHLAATALTLFDMPGIDETMSCRPDFGLLIYPVISFVDEACVHRGSRWNLLAENQATELLRQLSPELNVKANTPPVFIAHSRDDGGVPFRNSELLHEACQRAGVSSELHLFEQGGHGYGLGFSEHDASQWPARAILWFGKIGVLRP